jgi:hypothetical protein
MLARKLQPSLKDIFLVLPSKKYKMDKFTALKKVIAAAEADAASFYDKGNKTAGTRLRNAMQSLKVLATDIRKDVTEKKIA